MLRTIEYAQLDDDTKTYLRAVRNSRGNGSPGVFLSGSAGLPVVAFLLGLVILPLFVWAGYSSNKAAWANAMLQTAGVMLGGWLIVYAVRRWTASPDKYVGKFFYFDPQHVYVGAGEQLKYARLDEETSVEPVGTNGLRFQNEDGRFDLSLPDRGSALYAANYYDAIDHLNADPERWGNLSAAQLGAAAKYMVRNEQPPASLQEVDLDIDHVPEDVRPKRGGGAGFLRYLLLLAVGAGVFFAFKTTNAPLQDAGNFAAAKAEAQAGVPNKLRDYLLNSNNTAHREEAEKLYSSLYDKPIADVRAKGTDAELREGLVKLLETLRAPVTPAVSLRVTDTGGGLSSWSDALRTRLADGIGTTVGKDYIVFVKPPDDKPAHIEIKYSTADPKGVSWTIDMRLTPDDAQPYLTASRTNSLTVANPNGLPLTPSEAVYQDLLTRTVGSAPAAPPPLPVDNDW